MYIGFLFHINSEINAFIIHLSSILLPRNLKFSVMYKQISLIQGGISKFYNIRDVIKIIWEFKMVRNYDYVDLRDCHRNSF